MSTPRTIDPILPPRVSDLAETVLRAADDRGLTIAAAESCTGGLVSALLTDVEGLSHVFERGFVTYSERAKCDMLACEQDLIDDCGAVSRKVAIAMAKGALEHSEADIAVSITGFAGPGKDGDEEGLVHFACMRRDAEPDHREEHFGAIGRDGVRLRALETVLEMLKAQLDD